VRRGALDLRLVGPAVVAWLAAGLVVAWPDAALATSIALWAGAAALLGIALLARRGIVVIAAVCAVAAALVCASVAAQAPARRPAVLLGAADDGRHVVLTVAAGETLWPAAEPRDAAEPLSGGGPAAQRDPPYAATVTAVRIGAETTMVSAPVLVFGEHPGQRIGIGAALTIAGTVTATAPEDDVGFLVFAAGRPRVTRPPPPTLAWADRLRADFAAAASRLPGDGGDLLPGLAIGDTSAVGDGLDAAMKATSLSHLTAVSGANCAVVIGLIMVLGGAAGLPRWARIAASVTVLVGFVVLVTPQASVVRAGVMAVIVLLATLGGRPVRGVPVLALASLLLLVVDPWMSRDYGFALSVLATGGLLVLSVPLARLLSRTMPLPVAAVFAIPLAAQLACQPVLILLQPSIPLYGIAANMLAEPAAPIATVVGLLGCVVLPFAPPVGEFVVSAAWLPAGWIAAVASFFAGLPGAALPWPEGPPGVALLAVGTTLGLVALLARRRRSRLLGGAVAVALLAAVVGATVGIRVGERLGRPDDWQIAACDIGQGDAVLVRSAGKVALVDTGPDPVLLARCLDTLGIGRIDLLVLSHFDLDHVGGTEAVLGRVDRAIVGPSGGADDDRLVASLAASGAQTEGVRRGDGGMLGDLRYTVLWPRERLGPVEPGNEASVTIAFEPVGECPHGCLSSLFLGDLGERAQALVLAGGSMAPADVVKVSHHGSADQSQRLYERVDATVGVISVGADNGYGHPTDRLLDILDATGTRAERTDLAGLVLLSPGDERGEVRIWTERAPP